MIMKPTKKPTEETLEIVLMDTDTGNYVRFVN